LRCVLSLQQEIEMKLHSIIATLITGATLVGSIEALAQRRGDNASITIGIVERAQQVQLDAQAGRGALLGGAAGWALARNQSSAGQALGAAAGAGLGAAASNRRRGGTGMQYTVRTSQGSAISVVTDQTEVRVGDCVSVEQTGDVANIRRVDDALCQPVSPKVVEAATPALQAEAGRCEQAKERLFAATTPEEVEVARQVMDIMCND
jgi:outer membrane lipoprotein SlyB